MIRFVNQVFTMLNILKRFKNVVGNAIKSGVANLFGKGKYANIEKENKRQKKNCQSKKQLYNGSISKSWKLNETNRVNNWQKKKSKLMIFRTS